MEVLRDGSVETGCGVGASAPQRRSDVVDVHLARLDHRLGVAARRAHAAKAAGGASLISWLLAGVIIILLALVHAELGAAYPLAGGTARFPRLAFGTLAGFTAGWVAWLQAVTIAPIEVEAALSYLDHIWPGLRRRERRAGRHAASSWPWCSCSCSHSSTWRA